MPKEILNACITNNGELTDKYNYICKLRGRKRSWEQRDNYLDNDVDGPVIRLQRTASFISFKITGHLFDTKAINEIMDVLTDEYHLMVQLTNWDVGKGTQFDTSVFINVASETETPDDVFKALKEVQKVTKKHNVKYEIC